LKKKNGEVKKLNRNLLTNTTGNRRSVSVRNEHSNKFSSKEEEMNFWKTEVERLKKLLKRARRNVKRLENYTPENDKLDVDLTINRNHSDTTKIEEKKEFIKIPKGNKGRNSVANPTSSVVNKGRSKKTKDKTKTIFSDVNKYKDSGSDMSGDSMDVPKGIVFGVNIDKIVLVNNLPPFMVQLIDAICANGIDKEGILRIPGSSEEINFYKNELDTGKDINFFEVDVHVVAGVLKSFFRELPAPFIPQLFDAQIPMIIAQFRQGNKTESDVLNELKDVIDNLPEPNVSIFKCLIDFLLKVEQKSGENKMNLDNIIKCFVPSVGCSPALFYYAIKHHDFFWINSS